MATLKSIKNKYLQHSDGDALGVTSNTENIAALSFKLSTADSLSKYNLEIGEDKKSVNYTYNVRAKSTGITNLLQDLRDQGLKLKDLKTEESTLEKIFVTLVKENNDN